MNQKVAKKYRQILRTQAQSEVYGYNAQAARYFAKKSLRRGDEMIILTLAMTLFAVLFGLTKAGIL